MRTLLYILVLTSTNLLKKKIFRALYTPFIRPTNLLILFIPFSREREIHTKLYKPCDQDAGNFRSKCLSHLPAAHVGNAVQGQVHKGRVTAGKVILDGIID